MPERLPAFLRRRPPAEALAWVLDTVAPRGRIASIRRLRGGSASSVHALAVEDASGGCQRLVLRRYVRAEWLAREPDLAEREARVLRALGATALPVPEVIAWDGDGSHAGVPAVLMRRLPGHIDLSLARLEAGVTAMAELLARTHALRCGSVRALQPYCALHDPESVRPPAWTREPDAWRRVIAADREGPAAVEPALLHRDFHPGNVLWSRGRLVGLTDWVNASCGPPGVDVGHCRLNLVALSGLELAERFRSAYERASGRPHDPRCDARSLMDAALSGLDPAQAHDAGRDDLTADAIRERFDEYATWLAGRL